MVELQPGETRTLDFDVVPNDTDPATVILRLESADDVGSSSYSFDLNASFNPAKEVSSGNSAWVWGIAMIIVLGLLVGVVVVVVSSRRNSSQQFTGLPQPSTTITSPAPISANDPVLPPLPQGEEQSKPSGFGSYPLPPPPQAQPTTAPSDSDFKTNEEQDPNHKCWVCLENLPKIGWQACPECGSRYHLSGSQCGISELKSCRTCNNSVGDFVKVE